MPTPNRVWREILQGYRFIAYCTPPIWYWAWQHQRPAVAPAPWWTYLLGAALAVLSIVCVVGLQDEGVE
jgi:hypothetical protein